MRAIVTTEYGSVEVLEQQEIEESYLFTVLKLVYDSGTKESARRAKSDPLNLN